MIFFDIDFILFKILDYPISLLELSGTLSGLACVYLTAREKVSCWPVGIVNIVFFFILFYQVRLYSDMILQVYFLAMSIYGWWKWTHPQTKALTNPKNELKITNLTKKGWLITLFITLSSTFLLGYFMGRIHLIFPTLFKQAATFPYPDAFTTVLSVIATVVMAQKKKDCWIMWVLVDIAATIIYFMKGINLVAMEYIVFGIIAASGYFTWHKTQKMYFADEAA